MFDMIHEENIATPSGWPKTLLVVLLLMLAALVFSYLAAFAVTGALLNADLIDHWPPNRDPRPRWMLIGFSSMTGAFLLVGGLTQISTWRQSRRLDAMADVEG